MWKYDSFPYKLCAKQIGEMDNEGYVHAEGYGGMRFKPLRFFNDEIGKRICQMLKRETAAKRNEQRQLDERFEKIVAESLILIAGI
jgi:hypothetical protein